MIVDHTSEIESTFENRIERYASCQQPTIPFYSTVSGKRVNESDR